MKILGFTLSVVLGALVAASDLGAACTPEVCNNLDDDCNGTIDDMGWTRCGLGACYQEVVTCVAGVLQTCAPGAPSPEICNGIDDDCDGRIDDGLVQACSTGCGAGRQVCTLGLWEECDGSPCCDCTAGTGGQYTGICQAAAAGCSNICVLPGSYPSPVCTFFQAVSTQGSASTHLAGAIQGFRWGRLQGFTVQGSVEDQCGGELLFNRIFGNAVMNDQCGDLSSYLVEGNEVQGTLTVWGAAKVVDNVVIGGGVSGGGRGARLIVGNEIIGGTTGISFTGSQNGGANEIYDNRLTGATNGISVAPGSQNVGVVGNDIQVTSLGVQTSNPQWMKSVVAGNRIAGFSTAGVDYSGPNEVMGQFIGNLFEPRPPFPGFDTPVGVRITGSATVEENTLVGGARGVSAVPNPNGVPARLILLSNIVASHTMTGIDVAGPILIAASNDVYGNAVNWSGVPDPTGLNGNLSADPQFVSPADGDWSLKPGSICVDRGLSSNRPRDLAGHARRVDGDLDGVPEQDIGAFETLAEVSGLTVDALEPTLRWDPNPYATGGYDVYRGLLSQLHALGMLAMHHLVCGQAGAALDIPPADPSLNDPPSGDGYCYLVAPHGLVSGSLGRGSDGLERPINDPCP